MNQQQHTEANSFKSWAQQAEESYQLQLALARRVSSLAASADDPNFLDLTPHDTQTRPSRFDTPEAFSYRFWMNGCLSYHDRIPNGFYFIQGMDPYVWTISSIPEESGRIPSLESLKSLSTADDMPIEVVLIDKSRDHSLRELYDRVVNLSRLWISPEDAVVQLASLVCGHLGVAVPTDETCITQQWKECVQALNDHLGSVVHPLGSLYVGICVHRALLFKTLADLVKLPCRIVKGCKYCRTPVASSCLVQSDHKREYLVDLIAKPGFLGKPDSMLNSSPSTLISSPLCHPRLNKFKDGGNDEMSAKIYFDSGSLDFIFDHSHDQDVEGPQFSQTFDANCCNRNNPPHSWSIDIDYSLSPLPERLARDVHHNRGEPECELDKEDWDIQWSELAIIEKIGSGSFGTVHLARWRGLDVAVKILAEQKISADCFGEFSREVAIMKRLRHPNIVLFMGAITKHPPLSIVTEYLSEGSLFDLIQMPGVELILDEGRCLNMALDVAQGVNYLHQLSPPIVHRDLKSPNLLVDSSYTVKVCDFGLSCSKANTFLSSKTAGGTPAWMAPEVLRVEPSNEKADVYSFGVILWELMTRQRPWKNLNQFQVVSAVSIMGQRLEIPSNVNPLVASLIEACWADEPWKRPSFSDIIHYLQQLIYNVTSKQPHAHSL